MSNKDQIKVLETEGYRGIYSFEPFSAEVQDMSLDELKEALKESLKFIIE
jgi:predicted xylose isomerase-like sugar epimerase